MTIIKATDEKRKLQESPEQESVWSLDHMMALRNEQKEKAIFTGTENFSQRTGIIYYRWTDLKRTDGASEIIRNAENSNGMFRIYVRIGTRLVGVWGHQKQKARGAISTFHADSSIWMPGFKG